MTTQEKVRKPRRVHSAMEKCQAVLSIWAGRRKPSVVCKSLGVSWAALNSWEKRGIQGAMKALGGSLELSQEQMGLGKRLENLLEPQVQEMRSESK